MSTMQTKVLNEILNPDDTIKTTQETRQEDQNATESEFSTDRKR